MIEVSTPTVISADDAIGAAVADMELAAAVTATEYPGQQRLAATYRAAHHEALAVGVVGNQTLVPLELGPG